MRPLNLIPCEAPIWAKNPHLETILGTMSPSPGLKTKGERVFLSLPDGDKLVCRLYDQGSPIMVSLYHGLSGSINSNYIQRIARELLKTGVSVFLMNHRNCGEGKGYARHIYNSGRSEDIGFAINYLRKRFPRSKQIAFGFSLSANALLLLMAKVLPLQGLTTVEQFEANRDKMSIALPDLAITVNPPLNLKTASDALSRFPNSVYGTYFLYYLTGLIREMDGEGILSSPKRLNFVMPIGEFDDKFTAPLSGYKTSDDYYASCSAGPHLDKITTQTIILTAKSDPFVNFEHAVSAKKSDSILLHLENQGGHLGYIHKEKTPLGTQRWLDYALLETYPKYI